MASALYIYTVAFYELLVKAAEKDVSGELLYTGNLKEAFALSGASTTYYTPIRKLLDTPEDDPCITILQRGNSYRPSIVRLNHAPPERWQELTHRDLTRGRDRATLVVELEKRLAALEGWRESFGEVNIKEALVDIEKRLRKLEAKKERENGKVKKS